MSHWQKIGCFFFVRYWKPRVYTTTIGLFGQRTPTHDSFANLYTQSCEKSTKSRYCSATNNENFRDKTLICLFGLAVSLVSLTALRLYEWLFSVQQNSPVSQNWDISRKHSHERHLLYGSIMEHPFEKSLYQYSQNNANVSNSNLHPRTLHLGRSDPKPSDVIELPLAKLVSAAWLSHQSRAFSALNVHNSPPFMWTDASLNCAHFESGTHQVCMICWLNSIEGWVFGPCLMLPDEQSRSCFVAVENFVYPTWHRISSCHSGLQASVAPTLNRDHIAMRSVDSLPVESPRSRCTSAVALDRLVCLTKPESLLNLPRSSGDGAPSLNESHEVQETELAKLSNSLIDLSGCTQNDLARPVFYTADIEPECFSQISDFNTWHQSINNRNPIGKLCPQASEPTFRLNMPDSPKDGRSSFHCSTIQQRVNSEQFHSRDMQLTLSSNSLVDDGFEYDEILPRDLIDHYSSPNPPFNYDSFDVNFADEIQMNSLFATIDSLLDSPQPIESEQLDALSALNDPSKVTGNNRGVLQGKFSELTERVTALSEDLSYLEDMLSRLHYRTQAAQIELNQAEDNLNYVWHLRDNLEVSSSDSSRRSSHASSLSLVEHYSAAAVPSYLLELTSPTVKDSTGSDLEQSVQSVMLNSPMPLSETDSNLSSTNPVPQPCPLDTYSPISPRMTVSTPVQRTCDFNSDSYPGTRRYRTGKPYRKYMRHYRVSTLSIDVTDLAEPEYDSSGFECSELTFDHDGIVDWNANFGQSSSNSIQQLEN